MLQRAVCSLAAFVFLCLSEQTLLAFDQVMRRDLDCAMQATFHQALELNQLDQEAVGYLDTSSTISAGQRSDKSHTLQTASHVHVLQPGPSAIGFHTTGRPSRFLGAFVFLTIASSTSLLYDEIASRDRS